MVAELQQEFGLSQTETKELFADDFE